MPRSGKPSLVFFGTGPVSFGTLMAIAAHFSIEAVITKPDKTRHGRKLPAPVSEWAHQHKTLLLQPSDSAGIEKTFAKNKFTSHVGLVVDYGLIIPPAVISAFPLGIVNSHFSLLPQWRGADPITAAILSGQKTTGVSLMLIAPELDEGRLLAQAKYQIPADITIDKLTRELTELSNRLLIDSLPKYLAGKIQAQDQDSSITPTYTRKLDKSDGKIDWQKPAEVIEREIRAYLGWPGSQASLAGKDVLIARAHVIEKHGTPGDIFLEGREFGVYCGQNSLIIDRLKPAGKKDMPGADFRRGYLR